MRIEDNVYELGSKQLEIILKRYIKFGSLVVGFFSEREKGVEEENCRIDDSKHSRRDEEIISLLVRTLVGVVRPVPVCKQNNIFY